MTDNLIVIAVISAPTYPLHDVITVDPTVEAVHILSVITEVEPDLTSELASFDETQK